MPEIKKFALVTGASRGIGRAIAQRLAIDGYQVILHYNTNDEAARETANGMPGHHIKVRADLSEPGGVDELVAAAKAHLDSHLDVLVHNAGIYEPTPIVGDNRIDATVWQDRWRRQIQVNLLAGVQLAYDLLPLLQSAQAGRSHPDRLPSRPSRRSRLLRLRRVQGRASQLRQVHGPGACVPYGSLLVRHRSQAGLKPTCRQATFAAKRHEIQAGIPYGRAATAGRDLRPWSRTSAPRPPVTSPATSSTSTARPIFGETATRCHSTKLLLLEAIVKAAAVRVSLLLCARAWLVARASDSANSDGRNKPSGGFATALRPSPTTTFVIPATPQRAGARTTFLVDTGANANILLGSVAQAARRAARTSRPRSTGSEPQTPTRSRPSL